METWFLIILVSFFIFIFLKALLNLFFSSMNKKPILTLPPGPLSLPIIGNVNVLWLLKSIGDLVPIVRSLHAKFGPIVTLRIGPRPAIFIADRHLAHQALIQKSAVFADRPVSHALNTIISGNQHNINQGFFGPTWRILRRNLNSEILQSSRVKSYSHARKWALTNLLNCFEMQSKSGDYIRVIDHVRYAVFSLLLFMCFGEKFEREKIEEIQRVVIGMYDTKFNILNFWPRFSRIMYSKLWSEFLQLQKKQEDLFIPLMKSRKKLKEERLSKTDHNKKNDDYVLSYVDTIVDLQLPHEKRKLSDIEMVALCNEFLFGGSDTTGNVIQWIMANLVMYQHIQEKLFVEIKGVVGDAEKEIKEDDLQKMPYLKAVVLEGLRRHPPTHFLLPHAVTEDVMLGGYLVPKKGSVNFMVADIGWDPKVWEDPMVFNPERFIGGEAFDIAGIKEIKMMPFGAGRRMCPGYGLALLHLEYFVANLVWNFEWKAVDGNDIDLSQKQEVTMVMKNPLEVRISPRLSSII
ncbi:cytochrome P450 89A2 [Ricinus communis]|uniref:cytochrome P450 89A2 n=1 Tax=Ricinus communis TaxID=3988 RepID=UPI00201AA439|nr:cytochrome P450 89A2 [Ricinus communis]